MAIFDNVKKFFATNSPRKQNGSGNITFYDKLSYNVYPKDRYDQLAQEGYMQNAVAYRCVNEIANAASRVKINLFRGSQEIDSHPLLDLLNNPSPNYGQVEFFQAVYAYLLISGNSYVLQNGPETGEPQELYPLRPDRIRIAPASKGNLPTAYNYMLGGKVVETYQVDRKTGQSKIKHIKLFNPLDDYYGLSPIMAASMDIDQHNLSNKHNVALLQNGARPSGAVVFKPKDETGGDVQLTDSQRSQILNDLNQRFQGPNNAGRPMLLEGDFDWKSMGMSPKDMDFTSLKNFSARDIALVYGVPSQLVGVPDSQTYSNLAEARLALYTETVLPLMDRIQSDMNEWLTPQFGDDLKLHYDIDSIPAMAEQRRRVFESVTSGVQNGILTRNEAREQLGYDTMDGADELLVSATLMPLTSANEETPKDETPPQEDTREDDAILDIMNLDSELDEIVKAERDIDTVPTDGMVTEAKKGLEWRKEHGRGGTMVGVARANQIVRKDRLSPSTVRRMKSFFARHEVDKRAEGFRPGESGYPSAGRIAWALWGGDAGQTWSNKKVDQLDRERNKFLEEASELTDENFEEKQLTAAVREGLKKKVKDHNEKHGDKKGKRVTLRMLGAVFRRGIGAYRTNPASVRPNVRSEEQWAYARVNAFLFAVRTGRFRSGQFDRDLLPSGHPLAT
jgi:HK97 family phage portal protein